MKKTYHNLFISAVICLPFLVPGMANSATLTNDDIARMSMADKISAQQYFRSHSFDFPNIFSAYHPGPYWILQEKDAFNLSDEQVKQQQALKLDMAKNTIEDETVLKQAYKTYVADSAQLNPAIDQIMADIDAIGKAQTSLASEMVSYHLKSYALLDANQKLLYVKLAATRKPNWFMSILNRICPAK